MAAAFSYDIKYIYLNQIQLWCGAVAFDDSTPDPQCRVWICFSDAENKSYVMIVDARTPDVPLDRFQVSDEHVLCETYVPGENLLSN